MSSKFLCKGRPTITAMVPRATADDIINAMKKGIDGGADAFGIQLEKLPHTERSDDNLKRIFEAAQGKPVYVTNYRYDKNAGQSDEEISKDLIRAAKFGGALIDIMGDFYSPAPGELTLEKDAVERQKELVEKIHSLGAEVLISSHTHVFMPKYEVLRYINAQHSRGAEIAKVVAGAQTEAQVNENLRISAEIGTGVYGDCLFLCTGEYSRKHRIAGPLVSGGMFLCVPEYSEYDIPVQPLLSEAKTCVDMICKKIN